MIQTHANKTGYVPVYSFLKPCTHYWNYQLFLSAPQPSRAFPVPGCRGRSSVGDILCHCTPQGTGETAQGLEVGNQASLRPPQLPARPAPTLKQRALGAIKKQRSEQFSSSPGAICIHHISHSSPRVLVLAPPECSLSS